MSISEAVGGSRSTCRSAGRGERSRLQLLLELAGIVAAASFLAVQFWLRDIGCASVCEDVLVLLPFSTCLFLIETRSPRSFPGEARRARDALEEGVRAFRVRRLPPLVRASP